MNKLFDSKLQPATPAEVIFSLLERAIREGNLGIDNGQMWRKPNFVDQDINDYIQRLKEEATDLS